MAAVPVTAGEDFKEETKEALVEIARVALERHRFLSVSAITNIEDVAAFDHDFTAIETIVRDIGINVKKLHRYYRDGGTE